MAASWPDNKKTFTQLVDGTTKVEAINVNTVYDEVEAVQTYLGAASESQAKLASVNNLFRNQFEALPKITWIDSNTIEIEAKTVAMFSTNDYVIKRNTSAIQIQLSADLDTGAEAASTWYYIWLTGDVANTTYSAVFSTSAVAPTGYTYYKLINAVRNDSGSDIIEFNQVGRTMLWKEPLGFACGTDTSWTEIDITTACPAIAGLADFNCSVVSGNSFVAIKDCNDTTAQLTNTTYAAGAAYQFIWGYNIGIFEGPSYARAIYYKSHNGENVTGFLKNWTLNL